MARYDRRYDYGMRGFPQTMRPRMRPRTPSYDLAYDLSRPPLFPVNGRPDRVVAPYNLDYVVGNMGPRYPRDYNMYTGDRMDRMGDDRYMRRPYLTIGGTWTNRGSANPVGYDYPVYGPDYGGR
ncbi:MAG TPA: hypothetical protein VFL93_01995, partial [Longimicrobiaceae bacterium]|nr:hypothetical protein [Longimicrobiaceae bacterium]